MCGAPANNQAHLTALECGGLTPRSVFEMQSAPTASRRHSRLPVCATKGYGPSFELCVVSRQRMRKTKIIATLGPATQSPEMLGKLLDAGMNVARLNMSHAEHPWVRQIVKHLRAAAAERGRTI